MNFIMPYSKLYILTELRANDVKFISVDRQKLDLLIYIWYCKFYICSDTARFYEHKNDPLTCTQAGFLIIWSLSAFFLNSQFVFVVITKILAHKIDYR